MNPSTRSTTSPTPFGFRRFGVSTFRRFDRSVASSLRRSPSSLRPSAPRPLRAFTLIETALATVIVGVGVLAIVSAQAAFHQKNSWSTHASIAMHLGNEIREMTLNLPRHDPVTDTAYWGPEINETWVGDFDDLDDFDGADGEGLIFSADLGNGPLNARREIVPNMDGWSQIITVRHVDPLDITTVVADGTSDVIRIDVLVQFQGPQDDEPVDMTNVTWIAPR